MWIRNTALYISILPVRSHTTTKKIKPIYFSKYSQGIQWRSIIKFLFLLLFVLFVLYLLLQLFLILLRILQWK
jgi:hypothetical protein